METRDIVRYRLNFIANRYFPTPRGRATKEYQHHSRIAQAAAGAVNRDDFPVAYFWLTKFWSERMAFELYGEDIYDLLRDSLTEEERKFADFLFLYSAIVPTPTKKAIKQVAQLRKDYEDQERWKQAVESGSVDIEALKRALEAAFG